MKEPLRKIFQREKRKKPTLFLRSYKIFCFDHTILKAFGKTIQNKGKMPLTFLGRNIAIFCRF
jgi:hypothetical protein